MSESNTVCNQNWIVVINQRFFILKKRVFIHHMPPARAADKKSTQNEKHKKLKNEIMQPENSMDPGQISIQKLNEARENGYDYKAKKMYIYL